MTEKSKCCGAEVLVNYGTEGTNHYICPSCNNACDLEDEDFADHFPDVTKKVDLKPCPFCGSSEDRIHVETLGYDIQCPCGASMIPTCPEDEEDEVLINRWNTRAGEKADSPILEAGRWSTEPLLAENARLKELLRWCKQKCDSFFGEYFVYNNQTNWTMFPDCPEKQEIEKLLEEEWEE